MATTLTEDEKNSIKHLTIQFFNQHHYFSEVWKCLGNAQKNKILDIISEGKGIIPYEKIVDMNSMLLTPENNALLEKTEFYSDLKQKVVSDSDYESSFYLYRTLKMRHLGDMNDLFNAQDVTLLCEVGKNTFQFMHDRYGFKLRKCNSASTLIGCVEREMSCVIIALPTSNKVIDIFEQTITSGFSSVNTRLAFDTEILLPNLIQNTEEDSQKDYNYKICYNIKLNDDNNILKKSHNKNSKIG